MKNWFIWKHKQHNEWQFRFIGKEHTMPLLYGRGFNKITVFPCTGKFKLKTPQKDYSNIENNTTLTKVVTVNICLIWLIKPHNSLTKLLILQQWPMWFHMSVWEIISQVCLYYAWVSCKHMQNAFLLSHLWLKEPKKDLKLEASNNWFYIQTVLHTKFEFVA